MKKEGEDRKSNPRDGGDRQSAGAAAATKSHPALYLERILGGSFFKQGNIDWDGIDVCSPHVDRIPCEMESVANISYVDASSHFLIDFCTLFNLVKIYCGSNLAWWCLFVHICNSGGKQAN